MPIQLRNQTQAANLPSAASHGVGLPVSDGGLGAASRALGTVAQVTDRLGVRLARKEKAVDKSVAERQRLERIEEIRQQKELRAGTMVEEDRNEIDKRIEALSDFNSDDFVPWGKEGEKEIDPKILEPYQNNVYSTYQTEQHKNRILEASKRSVKAFTDLRTKYLSAPIEQIAEGAVPTGDIASTVLDGISAMQGLDAYTTAYPEGQALQEKAWFLDVAAAGKAIQARIESTDDPEEIQLLQEQLTLIAEGVDIKEGPEQTDLVTTLTKNAGRSIKGTMAGDKFQRGIQRVGADYKTYASSTDSVLDGTDLADSVDKINKLIPYAPEGQQKILQDTKHGIEQFIFLQDPKNTAAREDLIKRKIRGEDVWSGDKDANQTVRTQFEARFQELAEQYVDPETTTEERMFIMIPALATLQQSLFSDGNLTQEEKFAEWHGIMEDWNGVISPTNSLEYVKPNNMVTQAEALTYNEGDSLKFPADGFQARVNYAHKQDGDSFTIKYEGEAVEVRLFDTDTPEYKTDPDLAEDATKFTRDMLENNAKTLRFVPRGRGAYGRLLVDVVFDDGTSLTNHIIQNRKGTDGPNIGKKEKHVPYTPIPAEYDQEAFKAVVNGSNYNIAMEPPRVVATAEHLFSKNDDGTYAMSEQDMMAGAADYYNALVGGGYSPNAVADKYMDSKDPELQTMASMMKLMAAAGGKADHKAVAALVFDELVVGTTKTNWVDPAVAFLGSTDDDKVAIYTNTSRIINAVRDSGDYALAAVLDGYTERAVNYLYTTDSKAYKTPKDLAIAADNLLSSLFSTVKFSEVHGGMDDVILPANILKNAHISDKWKHRIFNGDSVTQKQFASVLLSETSSAFSSKYKDEVTAHSIYSSADLANPHLSKEAKKLYEDVNARFSEFLSGDANALDDLLEQGSIRLNYDTTDPKTGEPLVSYKAKQEGGSWKSSQFTVPLNDITAVLTDPEAVRKRDELNSNLKALDGIDAWGSAPNR